MAACASRSGLTPSRPASDCRRSASAGERSIDTFMLFLGYGNVSRAVLACQDVAESSWPHAAGHSDHRNSGPSEPPRGLGRAQPGVRLPCRCACARFVPTSVIADPTCRKLRLDP
jgi:hypothetical protein